MGYQTPTRQRDVTDAFARMSLTSQFFSSLFSIHSQVSLFLFVCCKQARPLPFFVSTCLSGAAVRSEADGAGGRSQGHHLRDHPAHPPARLPSGTRETPHRDGLAWEPYATHKHGVTVSTESQIGLRVSYWVTGNPSKGHGSETAAEGECPGGIPGQAFASQEEREAVT